jgi:hypothetical protein
MLVDDVANNVCQALHKGAAPPPKDTTVVAKADRGGPR